MSIINRLLIALGLKKSKSPAEMSKALRNMALTVKPEELGFNPANTPAVFGLLMETGYPNGVATLSALGDGSVSLYFSNGGGMIGIGEHAGPRKIAMELLAGAPSFLSHTSITSEQPLPNVGDTRFYFRTADGLRTFEAKENDLGYNKSPLSPLFHKCHQLITAARQTNGAGPKA